MEKSIMKAKRISKEIISGIYSIENKNNDKKYIGSSKDVYGRWAHHLRSLKNGNHHSKHLQNAWNKYGEDNFDFCILEKCEICELYEKEQYWYDYYNSGNDKFGYNMSEISRCPSYRASEKTLKNGKQTITYNQFMDIVSLLCDTTISIPKIAEKTKAPERTIYQIYFKKQYIDLVQNYNFKQRKNMGAQILNESDAIQIIKRLQKNEFTSDIAEDYNLCYSTVDDIRKHKTWKYLTEDIEFDNISKRKRNKGKSVVQFDSDGNFIAEYKTAREAMNATNINYKQISQCCNGNKKSAHGFIWRFKGDSFDKYVKKIHEIKVDKYDLSGNYIETFNSIKEANDSIISGSVNSVVNKHSKSAGGFYWVKHGEAFTIPIYEKNNKKD